MRGGSSVLDKIDVSEAVNLQLGGYLLHCMAFRIRTRRVEVWINGIISGAKALTILIILHIAVPSLV